MDFIEKPKKKGIAKLHRYWLFFLPLTLILALMIKFPLRIVVEEILYDTLFYGTISLSCIATAIRVYQHFGKRGYGLITIILLCSVLSGWQIFDLVILRTGPPSHKGFGSLMSPNFTDYDGLAWYMLRSPSDGGLCDRFFVFERYYGNNYFAITLGTKRDATWFACGG